MCHSLQRGSLGSQRLSEYKVRMNYYERSNFHVSGVTTLHKNVYCIGGTYGPSGTKYCFKLSEAEDKWERIANMLTGKGTKAEN